uniref:Uncharacterized protein n=1 Tax=Timema genevievae TaxID=629358 RepID=A0A7R9PJL6_TIMGE|nr:unnamed protein product [Timema genevievae]
MLFREAISGPVLFQEVIPGPVSFQEVIPEPVEAMPDPTADPVQLKKALEWELSLDIRDLRSHAWYHGAIPRHRAEEIVERDGDFVIRDCTSQPGNYVLTCRTKTQALHFVINKVVIQPDTVYERVQYQFEDDAYDTVPDLITFYVGSGKPISSASGARIQTPKNRLYPLSFYASKYGLQQQLSPLASPGAGTMRYSPYNSYKSPVHSPPRSKRETPPRLPCKKQRSHSLTPQEINGDRTLAHKASSPKEAPSAEEKSNSADGVIQLTVMSRSLCHHHDASSAGNSKYSTHSLPRTASGVKQQQLLPSTTMTIKTGKMVRVISDPALSPCMERRRFGFMGDPPDVTEDPCPEPPPPKPSRVPSLYEDGRDGATPPGENIRRFTPRRVTSYQASGSDSGNGSGDSAQSSAAETSHRGVIIKNPRYHGHVSSGSMSTSCSSATLKPLEYDSFTEDSLLMLSVPDPEPVSTFDLESFQTLLLPTLENKPLDATALQGVQMMLQETGSRILANHLTRVDLELTAGGGAKLGGTWDTDFGMGVSCGLELCALPHGHQLRQDLIERTQCLKLLVAVTILTCAKDGERAETINKWIQVAIDTKTALGNLYGFCGVMMGLCMPQIQRLTMTWHVLRQKFTDSAFNFEAKLRPTLKNMNECSNPQAPNTTIPHLLPFILLQEICSVVASSLGPWESTPDLGLGTLYAHLETARKFGESLQTFRRNAEIVLGEAKVDDLLTDTFRTEFHLKFLWGSRGAGVSPQDRHAKFEQVLSVMSEKCEPSTVVGLSTPV